MSAAPSGTTLVPADELRALVAAAFRTAGVAREPAGWAADALVAAELAGVSDHGVNLALTYVERIRRGTIDADGPRRIVERDPPVLRLDGGNGLGPATGWWAVDEAVDVARTCGACVGVVTGATHLGALGPYAGRAADRGMVALVTQATPPVLAPFGGLDAVLGNGPMAIAMPGGRGAALVLDMSCAVAAKAKISEAAAAGRPIPPGWALSPSSKPTTDATEAMHGVQLPWGHKGAGLAVVLTALTSVVAGAAAMPSMSDGTSRHVFMVLVDVTRFVPPEEYAVAMQDLMDRVTACRPADPSRPVRFPGQRAAATRRERDEHGVPVAAQVLTALQRLARRE